MNKPSRLISVFVGLAFLACAVPAAAQFSVLHQFSFGMAPNPNDGALPFDTRFAAGYDGTLYATTDAGGSRFNGVVLKMTREGQVTILHSFNDGTVHQDGYGPGVLLFNKNDGYLYGLTGAGGSATRLQQNGLGTFYRMNVHGEETILHNFGDGSVRDDAIRPNGLVLDKAGNFYGTAPSDVDGTTRPAGVLEGLIFRTDTTGKITILHHFGNDGYRKDGASPTGIMQGADGNFYGTTLAGGSVVLDGNGDGTIFKMTPGGVLTTLHSFLDGTTTNDGFIPRGGLIQGNDGNFYGVCQLGGAGQNGTLYKMTPDGVVTTLHSFGDGTTANDGLQPFCTLAESWNGTLYGTTPSGGSAGNGTIFKFIPSTGRYAVLHSFGDGTVANDGVSPYASLAFIFDGYLYGTAYQGGRANFGTIFKFPFAYEPPVNPPPPHQGAGG